MAERGLAANDGRDARFARLPRLDLRPRVVGGTVVANPQFPVPMRLRHDALEERVDPPAGVPGGAGDVDVRHRPLRVGKPRRTGELLAGRHQATVLCYFSTTTAVRS